VKRDLLLAGAGFRLAIAVVLSGSLWFGLWLVAG
jgi:hypothetical protein